MKTRIRRIPNYQTVRENVARQFREGFTLEFIATANKVSVSTVQGALAQIGTAVGRAPSQDSIGLHFKTVPPYRCKGCRTRTGIIPVKQTVKPCVLCAAELAK